MLQAVRKDVKYKEKQVLRYAQDDIRMQQIVKAEN